MAFIKFLLLFMLFSVDVRSQNVDTTEDNKIIKTVFDTIRLTDNTKTIISPSWVGDITKQFRLRSIEESNVKSDLEFYDAIDYSSNLDTKKQIYVELGTFEKSKNYKTFFIIFNPYTKYLSYKAKIKIKGKQIFSFPSVSEIHPGITNIESWPDL